MPAQTKTLAAALAALAALLLCGPALAAKPLKGRFYKGTTSQGTNVRLKVSKGGRWIGRFNFGTAKVQCDTEQPGVLFDRALAFPGVLRIARSGRFSGMLPHDSASEGAIRVRGRFVRRSVVRGTVYYLDRGCIGQNALTWEATAVPPASVPPPG